jgi:hypothetical protein
MKRLLLFIVFLSIISYSVTADCPGTDSDVTSTVVEVTPATSASIAATVCTSDAACGLSVTDPGSLNQGAATSTTAFTGNTPCSEGSQVFQNFALPWENVQGSTGDVINDAVIGGSAKDRIFTVGTIDNGATGLDMFIQAYSMATGEPIWRRVVALAGTQTGAAVDWEPTGSVAVFTGNDQASGNVIFYILTESGTESCNVQIGDGVRDFTANDVKVAAGPSAAVVGTIDSIDAFIATLNVCAVSNQRAVTSGFGGLEAFNKIEIDPSSNLVVVGLFQGSGVNSRALEMKFNFGLVEQHVNGFQFGTFLDDDEFHAVETDGAGNIYFAGTIESPAICAVDSTGAAIWPSSVYCKSYDPGFSNPPGRFSALTLDETASNVYAGGYAINVADRDVVMAKFDTSTGAMQWAKENSGTSEDDNDQINDLTFISTISPNKIVGVGALDSTNWGAIGRDAISGELEFAHMYADGTSLAKVVVTDNFNAFTFGYGTSVGIDYIPLATSATPEFSPATLLIAVLVAGGFIVFVVRRKQ